MRTKNIFSTLVLAAFAAACSNEELELANNSNELANGRFEIGQVELALGDGAESRYAVGPNFNDLAAEAGDELGAALIDTWNGTTDENDFKYDYTITNYIQTNYSFKYNGETWASEAKMVEGNYFFYAPYNAKHVTRAAVTAKFNPVQQLALNANGTIDELSTIKQLKESGEVMAVGYKFISREDGKTVKANLLPIYAYPLITLTNNYKVTAADGSQVATDLVIEQVVISTTDGFPTEQTFKFAEESKNAIDAAEGVVAALRDFTYWKNTSNPAVAVKGEFAKMNGSKANYTASLLKDGDAIDESSAIVVKAPANYTLKAGATAAFHVVMPAANYDDFKVELYTNKGVFELIETNDFAIAAGKRYSANYYNGDGTLKNDAEVPTGENMIFSIAGAPGESDNIVASAADLTAMIQNFEGNSDNNNTLSVQPLSSDVEINAAVMTAVKAKAKFNSQDFKLVLTAPATISANMNSSTRKVEFQKGAIIEAGEISINNKVSFTTSGTLTIKGGTVSVEAIFDNAELTVAGGEVTLKSVVAAEVTGGTLIIGADTADGDVTNDGGTVTFTAGANNDNKITYSNTIVNKKGTVTIPAWTILNSAIETNGTSADAKGTIDINANGSLVSIKNSEYGTVNVDGALTTLTANDGLVVMGGTGSITTVTANTGSIDNTKNGTLPLNPVGTVYYEFKENVNGRLVAKSSNYNTIILNGMTWAPEAAQELGANVDVIMKDATIEIWDAEATITINGELTAENSANGMSYVKGVAGAYVVATNHDVDVDGITETGAQAVKVIP